MVNYFLVAVVVAVITFIVMRKLTPPPPAPKPVPVKTFGLAQAAKAAPMFQQLGDQAGLGAKIAMGVLAMMEIQSRVGADLKALLTERDNQIVAAGERSKAAQNEILQQQAMIANANRTAAAAELEKVQATAVAALFGE
ncbi:MAG: hypothetical protein UW46_C0001G0046 [Candidatus Yanofskybacteria bacterium GW2011_GWF1_44_227]|uniref:Uncharacterized protein n=1 Tax=Candidatus Yanofskybacteria bacterium GW2011_GWE2_40_11 TaxID=1619033 RepID=A0A0G0T142_9BACT|nr:MAG: hypothetical protein UT75_C0004G0026 [Candidatus Yanofskybacteria bacterium GW2011_GWE2_40_11]KKT15930.1 MAG: hypothetical protein UV97_C0001G0103 [Candidatus Yanofskybacteria bacterium GW2011_GWF2_43_596]KKT53556.1 MAG: hypothetical protein UW46_C0001G0046 [Candidatus Yanofskybacteria bacterium GW2011_GWF1_44_227]OGN36081.1 MAG: hypothetical protein A2207_03420 [Candidatus Yanofskybacteria bacterium RIFOXYA1_FULL_44_17]OGN36317.1 MAG: hypothetical protein A2241_01065 [Candidatus Yanofs